MQPREAVLDWEEDEVRIIVLPSFEDRDWRRGEEGVLLLTAFASCMGNGYTLNVLCWNIRNVSIAEVTKISIKIEVINQK